MESVAYFDKHEKATTIISELRGFDKSVHYDKGKESRISFEYKIGNACRVLKMCWRELSVVLLSCVQCIQYFRTPYVIIHRQC